MLSIIRYELEKIIRNKSFLVLSVVTLFILIGIFQIGFNYSQLSITESHNQDKGYSEYYKKIANKHSGNFDDKKVNEILSDFIDNYQSESDVNKRPLDLFSWNIADKFFPEDKDIYIEMNNAMEQGKKITINQIDLKSVKDFNFKSFDTPLIIGSYMNWSDLFNVLGMVFILICIFVIIISSTIFSGESSSNINQLLLTTKYGRSKLLSSKIISSFVISISLFLLLQIITLIYFYLHYYGFDGWDANIQTNFSLSFFDFPLNINHLEIYILIILFQIFGVLSVMSVTLFISSLLKSNFASLLSSIGLFLLPIGLIQVFKDGIFHTLLYLFPINLYSSENMLTIMSSNQGYLLNSFIPNFILTIGVLIFIAIIFNIVAYLKQKKSFV